MVSEKQWLTFLMHFFEKKYLKTFCGKKITCVYLHPLS